MRTIARTLAEIAVAVGLLVVAYLGAVVVTTAWYEWVYLPRIAGPATAT